MEQRKLTKSIEQSKTNMKGYWTHSAFWLFNNVEEMALIEKYPHFF